MIYYFVITDSSVHKQNYNQKLCTLTIAQPYPSEQAAVEQEKVQNQLESLSAKLDEVANKKEPIIAFRATGVKDSGTANSQYISPRHGEF